MFLRSYGLQQDAPGRAGPGQAGLDQAYAIRPLPDLPHSHSSLNKIRPCTKKRSSVAHILHEYGSNSLLRSSAQPLLHEYPTQFPAKSTTLVARRPYTDPVPRNMSYLYRKQTLHTSSTRQNEQSLLQKDPTQIHPTLFQKQYTSIGPQHKLTTLIAKRLRSPVPSNTGNR